MTDPILGAAVQAALPPLLELAGLGLAGVISAAALAIKRRTGLEIEQKHRDALHKAIMSGVSAALQRAATGAGGGSTAAAIAKAAAEYAAGSVPDAMRALRPTPDQLAAIAAAKLAELGRL